MVDLLHRNMKFVQFIVIIIYGLVVGSFLNACIYRIPRHESLMKRRSHCIHCDSQLRWFDLIPIVSYVILRGRCRRCKQKISFQYPAVELLNMMLWVVTFYRLGVTVDAVIISLMCSGLIVLSVVDFRTYEIPFGINIYLGCLGIIRQIIHGIGWGIIPDFLLVSSFLGVVYIITKGCGIGGGDIKLMAAAGLLLGWQGDIIALMTGCLYGTIIHLLRMKVTKAGHILAMGPYLSAGMITAAWFMDELISWYIHLLG